LIEFDNEVTKKVDECLLIIKTSDTDVIVLCIYFDKQMTNTSELWVQMGNVSSVKDGRRFLPIPELCSVVLPDRTYAKLWSGMRHEEYADEAPLLKVVI
jgi:hypothetical protein